MAELFASYEWVFGRELPLYYCRHHKSNFQLIDPLIVANRNDPLPKPLVLTSHFTSFDNGNVATCGIVLERRVRVERVVLQSDGSFNLSISFGCLHGNSSVFLPDFVPHGLRVA